MNKLSIGMKIGLGFGLVSIMFIVVSFVAINNSAKQNASKEMVDHTNTVLLLIQELKIELVNAETGQRGYLVTGMDSYLEPYTTARASIESTVSELVRLTADNMNQQRRLEDVKVKIREKLAAFQQTIDLRRNEGPEAALKVVLSETGKTLMDEIRVVLTNMMNEEEDLLDQRSTIVNETTARADQTILWLTITAFFIVILLIVYYTRIIAFPIRKLSTIAEKISTGDLTGKIEETNRKDELGVLTRALTTMSDNLLAQFNEIADGVNTLSSATSEIMASVSQLAAGAAESATSISEASSTVGEIKQTAEVSNSKATQVSEAAQQISSISMDGTKTIEETREGMSKIKQQMESIADIVVRLSEQSQSIGSIAGSVNDLAEQSNLLAVNASIEAAKAGEHGKGFAVVAQEIKNLAERSKESTSQIRTILVDIQKAISSAVMATEQGGKVADEGLQLSLSASEVINTLAASVEQAAQSNIQIAASSQQQLIGMDQITTAMESIRESSMQTAASTKQTENSVSSIHDLGEKLQRILSEYKLK